MVSLSKVQVVMTNTGSEMCFNFASYYPMGAMNCGPVGGRTGFHVLSRSRAALSGCIGAR